MSAVLTILTKTKQSSPVFIIQENERCKRYFERRALMFKANWRSAVFCWLLMLAYLTLDCIKQNLHFLDQFYLFSINISFCNSLKRLGKIKRILFYASSHHFAINHKQQVKEFERLWLNTNKVPHFQNLTLFLDPTGCFFWSYL